MDIQNTNTGFVPGNYNIILGIHYSENVIWLQFDYDQQFIQHLREHTKARWPASQKA